MAETHGLKTNGLLKVVDQGEGYTILLVGTLGTPLTLPKSKVGIDEYRADARRVIDGLSKDMNPMGLDRFAAALLYELLVERYSGEGNQG